MSPYSYNLLSKHLALVADVISAFECTFHFVAAAVCDDAQFISHLPSLICALIALIGSLLGLAEVYGSSSGLSECRTGLILFVLSYALAAPLVEKGYELAIDRLPHHRREAWENWRGQLARKWNRFIGRGQQRVPARFGAWMGAFTVTDEATLRWAEDLVLD
jgi:hypothetical protein